NHLFAFSVFSAYFSLKVILDTDHDIDQLIEKTEKEDTRDEAPKEGGLSFPFAKIWAADKDSLEEVADDLPQDQGLDSWAQILERIEAEARKEKVAEVTGRGARRKAAAVFPQVDNCGKSLFYKASNSSHHISGATRVTHERY